MYKIKIIPRTLHFKQPAGTSRGVYLERKVWYLLLTDTETGRFGVGECAPLPRLSCDDIPEYETILARQCRIFEREKAIDFEALRPYPSILFGLETALRHLNAGNIRLWDSAFSRGEQGIPINGLIWMGNFNEMFQRIEEKIRAGFRCIKVKIGAINFSKELELLKHIRKHFSREVIELRVDANGAFTPDEAFGKLERLAAYDLHSIEQPIRAGQYNKMAELCASSPIPIALDEELIGVNDTLHKIELLDTIHPKYIILKPSLHGGIRGAQEWIDLAARRGIGFWATSALESNVGLNAIAQWCATLRPEIPQGLGTGLLFTDNIDYPLHIQGDCLWFQPQENMPDFYKYLNQ